VGLVLGRGLDRAAARDLRLELPGGEFAQARIARPGHGNAQLVDGAACGEAAAAADRDLELVLAELVHRYLGRAGDADPPQRTSRQDDLAVARRGAPAAIQHEPSAV